MRLITLSLIVLIIISACTGGNQALSDTPDEVVLDDTMDMAQAIEESETFASEAEVDPTYLPEIDDSEPESPTESPTAVPTNPPEPTETPCSYRTGWEIYRIRGGDTLWELSEATNTTVEQLMAANCLSDHILTVGQYFRLPFIPEDSDN